MLATAAAAWEDLQANSALKRNLEQSIDHQTKRFKKGTDFAPCGSSEIENIAGWLISENINKTSKSIAYDPSLCVGCDRFVRACNDVQGMGVLESSMPSSSKPSVGVASAPTCMTTRAGRPLSQTDCISCGQCTTFCPTGAIKEANHTA
jgi:predicted molibdopterin-dependent oxidoreductase YjgC